MVMAVVVATPKPQKIHGSSTLEDPKPPQPPAASGLELRTRHAGLGSRTGEGFGGSQRLRRFEMAFGEHGIQVSPIGNRSTDG